MLFRAHQAQRRSLHFTEQRMRRGGRAEMSVIRTGHDDRGKRPEHGLRQWRDDHLGRRSEVRRRPETAGLQRAFDPGDELRQSHGFIAGESQIDLRGHRRGSQPECAQRLAAGFVFGERVQHTAIGQGSRERCHPHFERLGPARCEFLQGREGAANQHLRRRIQGGNAEARQARNFALAAVAFQRMDRPI